MRQERREKPRKLTAEEVVEFLVTGSVNPINGSNVILPEEVHMAHAVCVQRGNQMLVSVPGTGQTFTGLFQEINVETSETHSAGELET